MLYIIEYQADLNQRRGKVVCVNKMTTIKHSQNNSKLVIKKLKVLAWPSLSPGLACLLTPGLPRRMCQK